MKIAVLGTGMVGRAIAGRLAGLGHNVVVGTRDVAQTLARTEPDEKNVPAYPQWQSEHPDVRLVTFADAGAFGDIVINATAGARSLAILEAVGPETLAGKVLVDIAVPLDYSQGRPPRLATANTDSLGEQIQRAFPDALVVKTLNTMFVEVMIDPGRLPGQHNVFVAGDDEQAKRVVADLLGQFGWPDEAIIDLGGIQAARATEMYVPLFFSMVACLGTYDLNIAVVRATTTSAASNSGELPSSKEGFE
jgi:predicted dinucleotide-binding enzyme